MNTVIRRARDMSLVLLVMAVLYHGHLWTDYSGARPGSGGLTRVSRDLTRRAGETNAEVAASAAQVFTRSLPKKSRFPIRTPFQRRMS